MDQTSPADADIADSNMSTSRGSTSSSNDDRPCPSLENLYRSSEEDEDFDIISLDDTKPSLKRYLYPQKEFVEELRPEEIRWFYKHENSKKWTAFIGYDSLRIECRFRALNLSNENGDIDENERILVRGGLFEVDVNSKKCFPVYWSGKFFKSPSLLTRPN